MTNILNKDKALSECSSVFLEWDGKVSSSLTRIYLSMHLLPVSWDCGVGLSCFQNWWSEACSSGSDEECCSASFHQLSLIISIKIPPWSSCACDTKGKGINPILTLATPKCPCTETHKIPQGFLRGHYVIKFFFRIWIINLNLISP